ncbi:hypothetical protein [Streptomyces flaveus]|uniref:Uncharacterized protein n=1 Tax=Streptomyces flaveus TaxID=66370 RepID=A0A917RKU0_9ACTN|nr:hypothetical protein [Streptomyces flaveus]GGL12197.1 hypothetical protein GCM10010094_86450 [Streptomyces flaveus]
MHQQTVDLVFHSKKATDPSQRPTLGSNRFTELSSGRQIGGAVSKALADLSAKLRRLHREAGEPTTRVIGKAIGYSHTTVAKALRGASCPSWIVLEKIVVQLRGDAHEFKRLWILARDELAPLPPVPGTRVDSEPTLAMAVESSPSYIRSESLPVIARVNPNTGDVEFVMTPEVGLEWMMNLRNSKGGEKSDE